MATSERDSGIPAVLWVVLVLAAVAGLGLLAKHYRMTREGQTPAGGAFAVGPASGVEAVSRARSGERALERRVVVPRGLEEAEVRRVLRRELADLDRTASSQDSTLVVTAYEQGEEASAGSDRWVGRARRVPGTPTEIELRSPE